MTTILSVFDLNDAWFATLKEVMKNGRTYTVEKGSFEGTQRRQLDTLVLHVSHPFVRPLAPVVPAGIPAPTSDEYIERYAAQYLLSPDISPQEKYTYGARLHEQLLAAIERLRATPNSNQVCIEVAQPSDFWLDDPPCLRLIQFQAREKRLDMYCYFRSWEVWAGLPTNLGGLQLVKEFVAGECNLIDRELWAFSPGAHLYDYSWELAIARLGKVFGNCL